MIKSAYIRRKEARDQLFTTKQRIIFGLLIGWILVLWGSINYFFATEVNDTLWGGLAIFGLVMISTAVVYPDTFALPSKGLFLLGNFIFSWLFKLVLATIFLVIIVPTGLLMKALGSGIKLRSWDGTLTTVPSNWLEKDMPAEVTAPLGSEGSRTLAHGFYGVLAYFMSQKHFVLLPVLLIMILLGLMLLFLQTSVIAPMIYTLF